MSPHRASCLLAAVITGLTGVAGVPAAAQQAYPMLMGLDPVAATVGAASEHTLRSRYSMDGASAVLVSGEGVTGEIVVAAAGGEPPKLPQQAIQVRFTVAADALPGVRDVRIVTPRGASTLAQLVITPNPVIVESGDNNVAAAATAATLPATLCGRIEKAEDVDHYRFAAKAGQTLSFVARCNSLQDRIHDLQNHADPILTLRSASGATLAMSDNTVGADPLLRHRFEADGDYLLEVRDVRYAGNENWLYAIEAGERAVARAIFPLAVPPEPAEQPTRPIGPGFAADAAGKLVLPAGRGPGVARARLRLEGRPDQAVRVVVHPGPFALESAAGDAPADAQPVALPVGIQGVVERPGDIDLYAFEARKGERLSFEVTARRSGSPLDGHLRLLDAAGKPLQANDDLRDGKRTFPDPRIENWTAPADGRYLLEIRDLNLRGGDDFVYFLEAAPATEDFRLFADTDKTPLAAGTGGVIFVRAERRHGFEGEITLAIEGLPAGVTAAAGRILAAPNVDGCIVLSAPADAQAAAANVTIRGSATVRGADGQTAPVTRPATIYQEIYLPGGGRGHWPAEMHTVSVGTPADIRRVTVAPTELSLAPGGSAALDVTIDRADGFDKNVLLEVHAMHLGGIFGDPLPKGVTVDAAASTTLLTGGATKGRIVLKAAADTKPVDRQQFVVIGNVSLNFVMKAGYASGPLVVSVRQ